MYKIILKDGTELTIESHLDFIDINVKLNESEKFIRFNDKFIIRKKQISYIRKIS